MPRPTPARLRFALAAVAAVLVVASALPNAYSQSQFGGGQAGAQKAVWVCTRCGKVGDGPGTVCRYCTNPNIGRSTGPVEEVNVDTTKAAERAGRAGKILGIAIAVVVLIVLVLGYSGRLLRAASGAPRPRRPRRNWYDDE